MNGRRARTIEELVASLGAFTTPEGRRRGLSLRARPDDVFIVTYPKSGTTWLQQICHGLRTGGDMDFDEITAVVPWLEMAHDMGMDPDAEQVARPRVFKSHLWHEDVPGGGRYICAIRDPADVLLSMYRFFDGWRMEPGAISVEEFALEFFMRREGARRYWPHLLSWWRERERDDVLLLSYESMHADLPGVVARIARFTGIDAGTERIARVVHQAGFAFMKRHETRFDDHLVRAARDAACGLPTDGTSTKVASGTVGPHRDALGEQTLAALDAAWHEEIATVTGHRSYAELRACLDGAPPR